MAWNNGIYADYLYVILNSNVYFFILWYSFQRNPNHVLFKPTASLKLIIQCQRINRICVFLILCTSIGNKHKHNSEITIDKIEILEQWTKPFFFAHRMIEVERNKLRGRKRRESSLNSSMCQFRLWKHRIVETKLRILWRAYHLLWWQ